MHPVRRRPTHPDAARDDDDEPRRQLAAGQQRAQHGLALGDMEGGGARGGAVGARARGGGGGGAGARMCASDLEWEPRGGRGHIAAVARGESGIAAAADRGRVHRREGGREVRHDSGGLVFAEWVGVWYDDGALVSAAFADRAFISSEIAQRG